MNAKEIKGQMLTEEQLKAVKGGWEWEPDTVPTECPACGAWNFTHIGYGRFKCNICSCVVEGQENVSEQK